MKKNQPILLMTLIFSMFLFMSLQSIFAQQVNVEKIVYAGPFKIVTPFISDSTNANGKSFADGALLKSFPVADKYFNNSVEIHADTAELFQFKIPKDEYSIHFFKFYISGNQFNKGKIEVSANGKFEVYVNGTKMKEKTTVDSLPKSISFDFTVEPMSYEIVIKYLSIPDSITDHQIKASYKPEKEGTFISFSTSPISIFTIHNLQDGKNFRGVSISPNGKYCKVDYAERKNDKTTRYAELIDNESGKVLMHDNGYLSQARWMPKSDLLYFTREGLNGKELITLNPANQQITIIESNLPEGSFSIAPDEQTLIYTIKEEGPKESKSMNRILDNSDRYDAFRNRYTLAKYDLKTGVFQPLTFGYRSTYLYDISSDSKSIIFGTSNSDYTKRPFSTSNLYLMDLQTLRVDTLYSDMPYAGGAQFSPNNTQLLIEGAPEAFNKVGLNIGKEPIANSYDTQLFLFDITTKRVTPLTKDFNPAIEDAVWNSADKNIYLRVVDQDCNNIYVLNTTSWKFSKLSLPEEVVKVMDVAKFAPAINFYGQSVSNADRLYFYGGKKPAVKCLYDLSKEKLQHVVLGKVSDWNFVSEDGTTIQGRYYLPPHFDSTKTYPMLVYYYGGTTPTVRSLEFSYSMHMYAALGYVVYTLNPSGTIGFGQEFSARHVNAWGIRTADEIILGTKQFCRTHAFVDSTKVGCFGASYGGFMTMYLQTQTDFFAAAISHAGISALTSYWGEGNWGIGYCAAANADSYPWNNRELFVNQSPLFSADKIKTPLLLLHGDKDSNVPVGESIQMYNALRILGKTVEFIEVEGEDHGVVDYHKRIRWAKTMQAWFAKYLQNQPDWWEEMYPTTKL